MLKLSEAARRDEVVLATCAGTTTLALPPAAGWGRCPL